MIGLSKLVENKGSAPLYGYAMPLTCRGGLMYLSILGKPTDKDLERYRAVHLTGPHEWDPSVLDYTHPSGDGEPP